MSNLTLKEYISLSWRKAVTKKKDGELILPYPFVPPCVEGHFRVLFYWDTYFTNLGLLIDGRVDLALNNVNDLIFALDHFGCVPNYTRDDGAKWCSQPPLLTLMVKDVYMAIKDKEWLDSAVTKIEKEYSFWMTKRITPIGLNQFGTNQKNVDELSSYYDYVQQRIGAKENLTKEEKALKAVDFVSEAESGEDFTPRYVDHNASEYVQIDLNSHLLGVEKFLSDYYADKDNEKHDNYEKCAKKRLGLLKKYCFDESTSLYFDYNFIKQKRSERICAACFLPFFYGFAKEKSALESLYKNLSTNAGIVACEDTGEYVYQWGYPNVWAPHQYFAYVALKNNGLDKFVEELSENYMRLLEKEFLRTGKIWERYDTGGVAKALEYETQPMLGWTAGVYNYFWMNKSRKNLSV